MEDPVLGSHRMRDALQELGYHVGRKRVQRLMRTMEIEPIYPKPRLNVPGKGHKKYPYLLRNLDINRSNQVWCSDNDNSPCWVRRVLGLLVRFRVGETGKGRWVIFLFRAFAGSRR